jgi:hypothetical protein
MTTNEIGEIMKLKVGDVVSWSKNWGQDSYEDAVVTGIQSNFKNGSKDGVSVEEIDWVYVTESNVIVDLDNGHWAWAYQIKHKWTLEFNLWKGA